MTNDDDNHRYQFVFDLANGTIIADSKSPKGPKLAMQSLPDLARIAQPGDALVHEIDNAAARRNRDYEDHGAPDRYT